MRREHSATTKSLSSSAMSSERFCKYKHLNLIAFSSTLVYIGFLLGSMERVGQVVTSAFSITRGDDGSQDQGRLRATQGPSSIDASASRDRISDRNGNSKKSNGEDDVTSHNYKIMEEISPAAAYAKGPVIHNHIGPVTSINLIGERHSGTNWITDHLKDCFGDQIPVEPEFTRFKHWFQFDDATVRNESALVVAMFRDPYDWIEAMRERPHHAHGHVGVPDIDMDHPGMEWKDFVSKPWVGPRGPADHVKMEKAKAEGSHIEKSECLAGYKFDEVIPCSPEDSVIIDGYSSYMYELKNDESHRAFSSIVELRTAKILNFLQVSKSHGVKAFFPERYEALNLRGTADFLRQMEEVTGLKANCEPLKGTGVVKHKAVDPEFTEWMNKYHDWNAEGMIGYVKRDPIPRVDVPPPPLQGDWGTPEEKQALEALQELAQPANAQVH